MWLTWIIAAAILLIIEVMAQQVWTFCLALGCLAALVADLVCGSGLAVQLVVMAVSSVLFYALLVPQVKRMHQRALEKAGRKDRTGMEALLGRHATVTEPIAPGRIGRVRIDGDSWQAECRGAETVIERGSEVAVTGYESIVLQVQEIKS